LLDGYNMWEVKPLKIDSVKANFKITHIKHDDQCYANVPVPLACPYP